MNWKKWQICGEIRKQKSKSVCLPLLSALSQTTLNRSFHQTLQWKTSIFVEMRGRYTQRRKLKHGQESLKENKRVRMVVREIKNMKYNQSKKLPKSRLDFLSTDTCMLSMKRYWTDKHRTIRSQNTEVSGHQRWTMRLYLRTGKIPLLWLLAKTGC